jgi:hypothetical protein
VAGTGQRPPFRGRVPGTRHRDGNAGGCPGREKTVMIPPAGNDAHANTVAEPLERPSKPTRAQPLKRTTPEPSAGAIRVRRSRALHRAGNRVLMITVRAPACRGLARRRLVAGGPCRGRSPRSDGRRPGLPASGLGRNAQRRHADEARVLGETMDDQDIADALRGARS